MTMRTRVAPRFTRGTEGKPFWQIAAAFAFGTSFCVVLLVLAFKFPDPTPFQYTVCRIVLAVAVAGVAALIPGFLHVDVNKAIRAGGALGVFIIVYFFSPASLVAAPKLRELAERPEPAVAAWLELIDSNKYDAAWETVSSMTRNTIDKETFLQVFRAQRLPLGAARARTLYSVTPSQSLPDGRAGNFRIYGYRTSFAGTDRDYVEWLVLTEEQGAWRLLSHNLGPAHH